MARVPRPPSRAGANNFSPPVTNTEPKISRPSLPRVNFLRHAREFSFYLRSHQRLARSLVLLLCSLLLFFILFVFVFRARTITCTMDKEPCPAFITKRLQELFSNKRLLFTNVDQQILAQTDLSPLLSLDSYRRFLPSTLEVHFSSVPFLYRLSLGDNIFYVDANSRLWSSDNPFVLNRSLPVLSVAITDVELLNFFTTHQTLPESTLLTLHDFALRSLEHPDLLATSVLNVTSSENYYLDFTAAPDYIFDPTAIDLSWQKYDWLIAHSPADSLEQYESIDLHFNSPVGVLK